MVAHRLRTVIEYDRLIILDKGEVGLRSDRQACFGAKRTQGSPSLTPRSKSRTYAELECRDGEGEGSWKGVRPHGGVHAESFCGQTDTRHLSQRSPISEIHISRTAQGSNVHL